VQGCARLVGARPLKAGATAGDGLRSAAVWAGFLGVRARPGRRSGRWTAGSSAMAVRRGKCGSRSKDGKREGDHGPDLEPVRNEPHARRGGRDCRSTARGADLAGRVPGTPAALWSAAALVFSRSTRL
jgi:hypothetical protein